MCDAAGEVCGHAAVVVRLVLGLVHLAQASVSTADAAGEEEDGDSGGELGELVSTCRLYAPPAPRSFVANRPATTAEPWLVNRFGATFLGRN